MRTLIILLLTFFSLSVSAQDFKFNGKTEKTENFYYTLGNDQPDKTDETDKKTTISFDGHQLIIGKETYKYIWHQLSKEDDTIELNCIIANEAGEFPYRDAKFEIDFTTDDEISLKQFISTSATTQTQTIYTIHVIKTTK